jgi:hypothetical protein
MKNLFISIITKKLLIKAILFQSLLMSATLVFAENLDTLSEGIPAPSEYNTNAFAFNGEASHSVDYNAEYTTPSLLTETLDKALTLPVGERIAHFELMSREIVRISKQQNRANEEFVRITLNRGVDVAQAILPIMGVNTQYIAGILANFYQKHFDLAKSMLNAKPASAEFGRIYSTLLWRFSAGLTSKAAKAIMLSKVLAFLSYDIKADPNRERASLKEVVADINRLRFENPNYQKVHQDLNNDVDPETINQLKSDVTFILHKLPGRLQNAGISPFGSDYIGGP